MKNNVLEKSDAKEIIEKPMFKKSKYEMETIKERLIEIKDTKLIKQLQILTPVALLNVDKIASSPQLYTVDIPKEEMVKAIGGGLRAMQRNSKGIEKIGTLKEVSKFKAIDPSTMMAQIAVMAIIKHEFEEVNKRLNIIDNKINEQIIFYENTYFGEIISLVSKITNISKHQNEIFENDKIRDNELSNLNRYEKECTDKLGKINFDIKYEIEKKNTKFEEYVECIKNIEEYQCMQLSLNNILKEIANLKYLFFENPEQYEYIYSSYNDFVTKSKRINNDVYKWHIMNDKMFRVDLINLRMPKKGLKKIVGTIQGLVNENKKYDYIDKKIIEMINNQKRFSKKYNTYEMKNVFVETNTLVLENKKYYYIQHD